MKGRRHFTITRAMAGLGLAAVGAAGFALAMQPTAAADPLPTTVTVPTLPSTVTVPGTTAAGVTLPGATVTLPSTGQTTTTTGGSTGGGTTNPAGPGGTATTTVTTSPVGGNANQGGTTNATETNASASDLPEGAVNVGGEVSIPAFSVRAPAHLVIKRVTFAPRVMRSKKQIVATVRVRDSRGYLVRDAIVTLSSAPLRMISATGIRITGMKGVATFKFRPTKLKQLRQRGRLFIVVRARTSASFGGTSTRRRVSMYVS